MGQMRDSDWSREILLRSDWSGPSVAPITTRELYHLYEHVLSNKTSLS